MPCVSEIRERERGEGRKEEGGGEGERRNERGREGGRKWYVYTLLGHLETL